MKLRILALLCVFAILLSFAACKKADDGEPFESNPPIEVNVQTLNGTTGFAMAKLMEDAANGVFTNEKFNFEVKTDASEVLTALINGSVDIASLPTNAASVAYNKTEGGVTMLAINTLGCLYLINSGEQINQDFEHTLKGKTVYVPAQNPAFILEYLCTKKGLTVIHEGTPTGNQVLIDSESYAAPANLRDAVATGAVTLAVLPEPMVTLAVNKAKQAEPSITIHIEEDLTEVWNSIDSKHKDTLVQGCIVVRNQFLKEHPYAVASFLEQYKKSVAFLTENVDEAAALIVKHGIFANEAVAKKAIPNCNVKYIEGAQMKNAVTAYLSKIMTIDATAIGGKVPEENFYYHATR